VGLDSYGWFFKQYRELEYALTYGYTITTSNAHNTVLQLFATGGVFVGLTYLVLTLIVTYCGILTIRKLPKEQKIIGVTLFATWLAFQSQSFISIDNIGVSVWGWLVGGSIVGLCQNNGSNPATALDSSHLRNKTSRASIDVIQPIISIFLSSISLVASAFLYQAERDTYEARSYGTMRDNTGREIVRLKFSSLSKNPIADPYYKFLVNLAFVDSGLDEEGYSGVNLLLNQDPRNLAYLNFMAYLSETKKDIKTAINSRVSITKFDPWNLRNKYLLGELYLASSELEKARKLFNEIVTIAPKSEEASLSKTKLANL
jgi:tetratricopeptide (TPR) repeat protein